MIDLKRKTIHGFLWNAFGTFTGGAINFIINIILARLLSPADFGIIAIISIFSTISATIIDSGFSKAIIRDLSPSKKDLSSVFFLNIFIAFVLYLILYYFSDKISIFFEAPQINSLSRVVFLSLIFNSFSLIHISNLSRQLQFKLISKVNILASIISGTISIILAILNFGVWALVFNIVSLSFFRSLLFILKSNWKPSFTFSINSIRKYFVFGSNLLIQDIIDRIVTNLESFFIGKIYSKEELGYFSQSRLLNAYINTNIMTVIQTVTYPALSKLEASQLKNGYRQVFLISMFILVPMTIFFSLTPENIIVTFLGEQWTPASEYLRIWSICGLLLVVYSIFINIFLVKGESRLLLKYSIIRQVLRVITIITLAKISILYMLLGILAVTAISCVQYILVGGRLINYSFTEVCKDILPILWKTGISGISVVLIGRITIYKPEIIFVMQLSIMIISYFTIMFYTRDKTLYKILDLIKLTLKKG